MFESIVGWETFEGLAERNFKLATGVCFSNVYGTTMSLVKMNDSIVLETNIVNTPTVLWIRPKRAIIIHKLYDLVLIAGSNLE